MNAAHTLSAGFADPIHDAQRAFRAALDALSRPGRPVDVGHEIDGLPLGAAMAHLLLALTDDDTAVWWQNSAGAALPWLRFHTGAKSTDAPQEAAFAAIVAPLSMPALDAFAHGTLVSPEFSTTLLVEVDSFEAGPSLQWHGPGIRDTQAVCIAGLPDGFWAQWQANHASFPQGVDVIFTCGAKAIGLPRTTRVSRVEGV